MQGPVVMRSDQQGPALRVSSRELEDQVGSLFSVIGERVLLQRTEAPQPLPEQLAHRHQPQGIPTGVTRHRELPQVRAQTLLERRDIHTFHPARRLNGRAQSILLPIKNRRYSYRRWNIPYP